MDQWSWPFLWTALWVAQFDLKHSCEQKKLASRTSGIPFFKQFGHWSFAGFPQSFPWQILPSVALMLETKWDGMGWEILQRVWQVAFVTSSKGKNLQGKGIRSVLFLFEGFPFPIFSLAVSFSRFWQVSAGSLSKFCHCPASFSFFQWFFWVSLPKKRSPRGEIPRCQLVTFHLSVAFLDCHICVPVGFFNAAKSNEKGRLLWLLRRKMEGAWKKRKEKNKIK